MAKATGVNKQASIEQAVSESKAAVIMWEYYRDNKSSLVADIREYRDHILSELKQGKAAALVFKQFTKVEELQIGNVATARAKR